MNKPKPRDELVFLPLGGSNEIGMNLNLYGYGPSNDRKWIVVDLGVTFGDQTTPGVEIILPDPTYLEQVKDNLLGIVLTHAHEDHIADLARLAAETKAAVWISETEPFEFPGLQRFKENAYFHIGELAIKTLLTWGHSPGMTSFHVTGLSWPLAICGDAIFSCSMGGSPTHFADQFRNNQEKLLTLPKDTVIAPGHGPLTTLAQEKHHNPFFAR